MRRVRVALVSALAAVAVAAFASSAMAGGSGSTLVVGPTATSTGSATLTGFNLNCSIVGQNAVGTCAVTGLSQGDVYRVTVQNAPGTVLIGFVGCPQGGAVITNPTVGGYCQFATDGSTGYTVFVTLSSRRVTVTKGGNGSGTVTSSPAGINCGPTCAANFTSPTVTLTATPAAGSGFSGWGGACAGAGTSTTCTVSTALSPTVTATFTVRPTFTFSVSTAGNGSGTVTSSPSGLLCPPTCTAAVVQGTTITLTPNAAGGSEFGGWSGSCTGLGNCTITVNAPGAVTATFNRAAVDATVLRTFFTKNGPKRAERVLHTRVAADEQVRVSLRIVRNGIVLASRTVPRFSPGTRNVNIRIRNGIGAGRAQLRITLTDQFGNSKSQSRRIRIPEL